MRDGSGPEVEALLDRLARDSDLFGDGSSFTVSGFLLRGEDNAVRLVSGGLCLDLLAEDVLAVEEQPLPDGLARSVAIPVRMTLRAGARVLRLCVADMYVPLLFKKRVPFAMRTRLERPDVPVSSSFARLEAAYKHRHSLA